MKKPKAPCKDCEFHSERCHVSCGFYEKFQRDLHEWNQTIRNGKTQLYSERYTRYVQKLVGEI